jgi:hypothetical protein
MENVEKIDIMLGNINCYDYLSNEHKIYLLTEEYDFFMNIFSDAQDLLSINITDPQARLIKFYNILGFKEGTMNILNYTDMNQEQKEAFDAFIAMIKSKN